MDAHSLVVKKSIMNKFNSIPLTLKLLLFQEIIISYYML